MITTQSKLKHQKQKTHFIIIKILFFLLSLASFQKTHNKLKNNLVFSLFANFYWKIKFVIERAGIQKFICDSFDNLPSDILIKGKTKESIKNYSLKINKKKRF